MLIALTALLGTLYMQTVAAQSETRKWKKEPITFVTEDLSHITLYGSDAVYKPSLCPGNITFAGRARNLPSLPSSRMGFPASNMYADGHKCQSVEDAIIFDMFPIGSPAFYPPQWIFERSSLNGEPVELSCGPRKFAIRYGYFNDVRTEGGFLKSDVVYFDFAVIPNSEPFAFCSYATRRGDGKRPIFFAPFPSEGTWEHIKAINEKRSVDSPDASPSPAQKSSDGNGSKDGLVDPDVGDDSRSNGSDGDANGNAPMPSPLFMFTRGSARAADDNDGITVLAAAGVATK